jgi:hypothetical protein
MYSDRYARELARENFKRARLKDIFLKLFNVFTPENYRLLSFEEVKKLVKPENTRYQGIQAVPINLIVGSEGRYRDFNKAFLPRYDYLKARWEGIDNAHHRDITLPPIKLYEIGGVYFVSDGNHRVSVAKNEGWEYIDAEITVLKSKLKLKPGMNTEDIKKEIIKYEKKEFFKNKTIKQIVDPEKINFTTVGSYNEVLTHIDVHKYYINLDKEKEIPYENAVTSWYNNLFLPIYNTVDDENLLARFPGRTEADLYVWVITHWDHLKRKYGQNFSLKKAAEDYSERFGKTFWEHMKIKIKKILRIKK